MTHEVRELNVEDMMIVSDVIDELISNVDEETANKIFSGSANPKEVGMTIIKAALKHARKPAFEFLANVNDMTIDEFKKQPASFAFETIKAIKNNPKNKDFFSELRNYLPQA